MKCCENWKVKRMIAGVLFGVATILLPLGVFLSLYAGILLEEDSHARMPLLVLGPILCGVGLVLAVTGSICCLITSNRALQARLQGWNMFRNENQVES